MPTYIPLSRFAEKGMETIEGGPRGWMQRSNGSALSVAS